MPPRTTYTDSEGRRWTISSSEAAAAAAGKRTKTVPPPQVTVRFRSGDDSRSVSDVPADWHKPDQLEQLFRKAK
jgi:hypothetical protein